MKGILRGTVVTGVALGVLACAQQLWRVTYTVAENDRTYPSEMAVGTDGRVVIVGTTGSDLALDEVFITAFDAEGVLLWEYVLPREPGTYTELVALDEENNSYLARDGGKTRPLTIYKFDPFGNLLTSWAVVDARSGRVEDIKIGPDNNVYLAAGAGQSLYAFAPDGGELWRYQAQENGVPYMTASLSFLANGHVVHASDDLLTIVSPEGEMQFQRTAESAGLNEFSSMVVANDAVVVIGDAVGPGAGELVKLNDALVTVENVSLEFDADFVHVDSSGAEVCAVLEDWQERNDGWSWGWDLPEFVGNQYVHYNADTGEFQTIAALSPLWVHDVVSANHACYVGGIAGDGMSIWTRIVRYDFMKQTSSKLVIQNSTLNSFELVGRDVVRVGGTGDFTADQQETFISRHRWK